MAEPRIVQEKMPWKLRQARMRNRLAAFRARFGPDPAGFFHQPEPRSIGSKSRGLQLVAGNFLLAGHLVEAPKTSIWDLPMPTVSFEAACHGCAWLDDLAALGDRRAQLLARSWVLDWIGRYGQGQGPGWVPDLAGRRLIRWVNHALVVLNGTERASADAFYRALGRQIRFLEHRWRAAAPGLAQFEALCGLAYAGLSLKGMERATGPALKALEKLCLNAIDDKGGLPTRNPEELMEVFSLLVWVSESLEAQGTKPGQEHQAAIARIAPTLRALRHTDGSLARFHGGGRGLEGRLDQVLAASGIRGGPSQETAMGFLRLCHARTSVIVDAASPPTGDVSTQGHASTLGFELTSGRRPLVVNCGAGHAFGEKWRKAGRATPSHSTLVIEGYSSSRLGQFRAASGQMDEGLFDVPQGVRVDRRELDTSTRISTGHDGWRATHGLTHMRQIGLSHNGRKVTGEDRLVAIKDADQKLFDHVLDSTQLEGIKYNVRFHLHPDAQPSLDLGGQAVSIALKSGEIWIFRYQGRAELSLEPSVFLEADRLSPRASRQIVLAAVADRPDTRLIWTLAKAHDTPDTVRDTRFSIDAIGDTA